MVSRKLLVLSLGIASVLIVLGAFWSVFVPGAMNGEAEARHHQPNSRQHGQADSSGRHHSHSSGRHHHGHANHKKHMAAEKHAYSLDFFMMKAPVFDCSPLDDVLASKVKDAFARGIADDLPAEKLVRAGVFHFHPLSGGIFQRRETIKYIVLHSTETGIPVPAKNVINGWNSMGRRHPGAQFVVDRNGTIYLALDPELASVHVNIFKTLPGINNDNTIGIEMNHTGKQDYPLAQRQAAMRLVTYLQNRYKITGENVITHRYAQQGDHTDPVNFDLDNFLSAKEDFRNSAIALRRASSPLPLDEETEDDAPLASVYVQIHGLLPETGLSSLESKSKHPASSIQPAAEAAITMPSGTFVAGASPQAVSSQSLQNTRH